MTLPDLFTLDADARETARGFVFAACLLYGYAVGATVHPHVRRAIRKLRR